MSVCAGKLCKYFIILPLEPFLLKLFSINYKKYISFTKSDKLNWQVFNVSEQNCKISKKKHLNYAIRILFICIYINKYTIVITYPEIEKNGCEWVCCCVWN